MSDINFIPRQRLIKNNSTTRLHLWFWIAGIYVIVVTIALSTVHAMWRVDDAAVSGELDSAVRHIEQYNTAILRLRAEMARITAQLQTSQVVKRQPDWSRLLILLSDTLGPDVVLSKCELQTLDAEARPIADMGQAGLDAAAVNALLSERRYRLDISGFGRKQNAVSQFVVRLEQSGLFDVVTMTNSHREDFMQRSAIAFTATCRF